MNSIIDWFKQDLTRTAFILAILIALLVVVVVLIESRNPDVNRRLPLWRGVLAGSWIVVVIGAGLVTRLDPDLHICKTTSVSSEPMNAVETSTNSEGDVTGKTKTHTPVTVQSTRVCEPLGIPEIAVLSLPSLILIGPLLKGFNIAGLFGFDFREFKETVVSESASESKDQVLRIIVESDIGDKAQRAVAESGKGILTDLDEL